MGTNYYLYSKNKNLIKENFVDYELLDEPNFHYEVHLCKLSCGWCPLFQNHKAFSNFEELEKFVIDNKEDVEIFDEYNEKYDFYSFKDIVIKHSNKERRPYKFIYKVNELISSDRKIIDLISCEEDEAEVHTPFVHSEYSEAYSKAELKYRGYIDRFYGSINYRRDNKYNFDWTEGDFS